MSALPVCTAFPQGAIPTEVIVNEPFAPLVHEWQAQSGNWSVIDGAFVSSGGGPKDINTIVSYRGTPIADLALNYTPGTNATGIVDAAYTNNDLAAQTATTLFDLDTSLDQIAIQAPPNNGSLNPTGMTTVDSGSDAGFDIYSELKKAVTFSNRGYAVLSGSEFTQMQTNTSAEATGKCG